MGKVVKPLAIAAGLTALAFVTGGASLGFTATLTGGIGIGLSTTAIGATLLTTAALTAVQGVIGAVSGTKGGKVGLSAFDPRAVNTDPNAPRTICFGPCAFPINVRYVEPSGTDDEYIDYVIALAGHRIHAVDEIWFDEKLAWNGSVQAPYAGFLWVEVIEEAGATAYHTVNDGSRWGAAQRMTGCATMKLRIKRSANAKTPSPLQGGLPGRITAKGRGMPVYDPARDSTMPGGSGAMRWDDTSTWEYEADGVEIGANPALQSLSYLIGWRVGDVVSVGPALPVTRIGRAAMAASARLCEEDVTLAAGGTEPRYRAGGAVLDSDDPMAVLGAFAAACCGEWVDDEGELSLRVAHNDLATATITLTDDDFMGPLRWVPQPPIAEQFTVARAKRTDAEAPSLFGMIDVPEVAIPRSSAAPRTLNLELRMVQHDGQAQRLTNIAAQRSLYRGELSVRVKVRGWLLRRNMVVMVDHAARDWDGKLFRVRKQTFNADGSVDVVLREENAAVHEWDEDEVGSVQPVAPVPFDPSTNALALLTAEGVAGREAIGDNARYLTRSLDNLSNSVTRLTLEASTTRAMFRDAGIVLDPANGEVRIFAVDRLGERLSAAEITISAFEDQAEIIAALSVTVAGKADASAVDTLSGRVTVTEGAIDAQAASITDLETDVAGKASSSALSALDTRVTTAEGAITTLASDITSLESDVAGKASSSALSALDTRVTAAEGTITTLASDITSLESDVAGKASSSALSALDTRVTTAEGTITSIASDVTTLESDVAGKASASAVSALDTRVMSAEGAIDAQAAALIAVTSDVGDASATATLALSTANGNEATVALSTNVGGRITSMRIEGADGDIIYQAENVYFYDTDDNLIFGVSSGRVIFGGDVIGDVAGVPAATIAATATSGGVQTAPITALGASPELYFVLNAGASRSAEAEFGYTGLSGASTVAIKIQYSVDGGSWTDLGTPGSALGDVGEPVNVTADGTYTNSSGVKQALRLRAFASSSGGAIGTVTAASFVRA